MPLNRPFMKPLLIALTLCTTVQFYASAQILQTVDQEGTTQAALLKKINKKSSYGAYLIDRKISFGTTTGITGQPVVTATEEGDVEMTAMKDAVGIGYVVDYNRFVNLKSYKFNVWASGKFRRQYFSPEKVSLTDESIFFDDSYGQYYGFKANGEGQRCRFKYEQEYTDAKYLTRIFFHEFYPVKQNKISFTVPNWLKLDIAEMNFEGYHVKKDVKQERRSTTYTYTLEDVPAVKQEKSSLARPYYLPHLVITVRSYTVGSKDYTGFKTLGDMYAWYNYLYKKCDNKRDVLKAQVALLLQGKTTDEEKVKALYYWVQDNIRYFAFEEGYAGFVPQTVQEVYGNKYGDCKGMANLLTEMMKLAGYDAHLAWIGTREIPYDHADVQSLCVDNHCISVLYLGGKTYYLDGTEKYAPLGVNAYRIQGKSVLVENGDGYKLEHVPAATVEDNQVATVAHLQLSGDKITGHVTMTFNGATKNLFHYIYNNIPSEKRKDFIKSLVELQDNNSEASNIKTSDFKNRDIALVLEGDVSIGDRVTRVDSVSYLGIDFFPATLKHFLPEEDRQSPMDIGTVYLNSDEVTLEIPSGARAKYLPESFHSAFNDDNIAASYVENGHSIVMHQTVKLNSPVIKPGEFAGWKDFVNKIRQFNRNNISIRL